MNPKCVSEETGAREESLCELCLEQGGLCTGCVQWIGPRLAMNIGWLRLIAAAKVDHAYAALRETPILAPDAATAKAMRREDRKATKARTRRLVRGRRELARSTRPLASLTA